VLFFSSATNAHGDGRLTPRVIISVFYEVCSLAGVEGHTPHDARHAMGRHLIEKIGNSALDQTQNCNCSILHISTGYPHILLLRQTFDLGHDMSNKTSDRKILTFEYLIHTF